MSRIRDNEWWHILSNYESSDLVKARFKAVHGRELNTGKAREICASVTQARSYMESAYDANRNVRPLLIYYGILGLARGLTLFLSTSLREAGLAQAHGLSVTGWSEELAREGGSIIGLTIKLNSNGTLQQLIEATKHRSYLRSNSSKPNFIAAFATPIANTEVQFADVLSRIPEIRESYSRWQPAARNIVALWPQNKRPDGSHEIRVDPPYTEEDIRSVLGDAVTDLNTQGVITNFLLPNATHLYLSDVAGNWNVGNLVAMKSFPDGVELSKTAITFITGYMLGMLARYYPSQWTAILNNQSHTGAMPSLLAAMDYIAGEFPKMAVEFLEPPTTLPK